MGKHQKISCFFCPEKSFDIVRETEKKEGDLWKEKISRAEKLTNEKKSMLRMFPTNKNVNKVCNK